MHPSRLLALIAAAALPALALAKEPDTLVRFSGAIGVDPLTAAGGADALNTVRGIAPGGRAWVQRKLRASVGTDGTITVKGAGLVFASGDVIGTRGTIAAVGASLFCGPANATAARFDSPLAPLDSFGNFSVRGALTQDGVNAAVMPATCDNPVLLIRAGNPTTGALGAWFSAGIPSDSDDD